MTDSEIGSRLLEILPVNVGLTHEQLSAKLGGGLPYSTLETLFDMNLAEQYVKRPGAPIRWRWCPGVKGKHDVLTGQLLHDLCRDADPWTEKELEDSAGLWA